MKKKMGDADSKKLKTKSISIRMTVEEMEKVDQFAAEFNLPTGMYMRLCSLLGYLPYAVNRSGPTVPGAQKVDHVREIGLPGAEKVGTVKETVVKPGSARAPSPGRSRRE